MNISICSLRSFIVIGRSWYSGNPVFFFEFFQAAKALFQFEFHVVVHAALVFGFMFTLEEHHDSSPFFAPSTFSENGFWDRFGEVSAVTAVLDMLFLEPFIWEFSPFSTFNGLDHGVDIKIFILVNDIEFLKYAGSVSKLSLHFFGFMLQFFSQSISKLENIIGGTFVSVHLFHHILEELVLLRVVVVLAVFRAPHVTEWRFIMVILVLEHLFHHHLHHHFLHHVILWSLLLSENKLDWCCLALLATLVHHGHGFEQFLCFEIFGAFKQSMDESVWVVVHWKIKFCHVHSGT